MRIRFTEDCIYETGGPGVGPKFEKGLVLDAADVGKVLGQDVPDGYPEAFLQRWLQRNVAVEVDGRAKVDAAAVEAVAESAPEPDPAPEAKAPPKPVPASAVSQSLGTAKHGRPTKT